MSIQTVSGIARFEHLFSVCFVIELKSMLCHFQIMTKFSRDRIAQISIAVEIATMMTMIIISKIVIQNLGKDNAVALNIVAHRLQQPQHINHF